MLRIVETEAYLGAPDRASHAWGGRRTERNRSLYEKAGTAYVYFIYGMYFCLNAVTGAPDNGEAVLIRAGEPIEGEDLMVRHRRLGRPHRAGDLAGGPGKLCIALAIDRELDGRSLLSGPLTLTAGDPISAEQAIAAPRIGIDYAGAAAEWPLRFAIVDNPHVSRPQPWT